MRSKKVAGGAEGTRDVFNRRITGIDRAAKGCLFEANTLPFGKARDDRMHEIEVMWDDAMRNVRTEAKAAGIPLTKRSTARTPKRVVTPSEIAAMKRPQRLHSSPVSPSNSVAEITASKIKTSEGKEASATREENTNLESQVLRELKIAAAEIKADIASAISPIDRSIRVEALQARHSRRVKAAHKTLAFRLLMVRRLPDGELRAKLQEAATKAERATIVNSERLLAMELKTAKKKKKWPKSAGIPPTKKTVLRNADPNTPDQKEKSTSIHWRRILPGSYGG